MSVQLNGIIFSNINTIDNITGYGTKKTKTALIKNNKYSETTLSNMINAVENGNTTWDKIAFINAIDIDWNGAQWPSTAASQPTTINTTGDLLKAIKWASQQGGSGGGTTYEAASTDNLGLIKIFDTTSTAVNSGTNRNYGVKLDKNNKAYVYVPWQEYILSAASSETLGGIKEGYNGELPSSYGLKFGVKVNLDEPNTPKYGCAYIGIPFASSNHAGLMSSAMFSKLNNISTNSSGGGNYSNASSTGDGLMSSANYVKLEGITNNANRIELASTDGSINLVKYTKNTPSTLLSFVSNSSFTLPSSDLAIGDGKNFPVILDAENKPFVKVPVSTNSGVSLSTASTDTLGGIKVTNVVNSTGNINSTNGNTNGKNYGVQVNGEGQAFVNIPWYTNSYYSDKGIYFDSDDGRFDLKPATTEEIGGIVLGFNDSNDQNQNYPVELEPNTNKAYVHVDWHNANTEYNISINGSSQPSTSDRINNWTSIYAPTTSGSIGQILKSNGANIAPTWMNLSTASASTDGLMSSAMFTKLNNVEYEAHASVTAPTSIGVSPSSYTLTVTYGITQIQLDEYGHVIGIA